MVIILCSRNLNVTFTEYCDKRSYFYKLLYYDLVFFKVSWFFPLGGLGVFPIWQKMAKIKKKKKSIDLHQF